MPPTILVVDDEEANRLTLERILVREKLTVTHAPDGRTALEFIHTERPDLILTDLKMPGMDGMSLLRAAKALDRDIEVILMTAYGTVENAVEAMKDGAYDFITKPLRRSEIVRVVRRALEKRELVVENRTLRSQLDGQPRDQVIGHSSSMQAVIEEARQAANSHATVLLTGESGTGKGILARWMHRYSPRKNNRLVEVNCSALPENLLESELFGYEAGAFTDAKGKKEGRFDLAHEGTLFLDEIAELPTAVQAKLLRVLQDGSYERLGGTQTIQSDVRLLAATNKNVENAVQDGSLRQDLYYRLNVIQIRVPPLRERMDDIPFLARHFISQFAARHTRNVTDLSHDALMALESWHWPGNVRELENTLERAVVLCKDETIDIGDLPTAIGRSRKSPEKLYFSVGTPLRTIERRMIEATLKKHDGDRLKTAEVLGTTVRTLYRREAEWRSEK